MFELSDDGDCFVGLADSGVEAKSLDNLGQLRLQMRGHSRTNVLEGNVGRHMGEQNVFDTAVSSVRTRAQKDGSLFGSVGNVVSREIELRPLDVRLPVSGVEVKRAQGTMSYGHG